MSFSQFVDLNYKNMVLNVNPTIGIQNNETILNGVSLSRNFDGTFSVDRESLCFSNYLKAKRDFEIGEEIENSKNLNSKLQSLCEEKFDFLQNEIDSMKGSIEELKVYQHQLREFLKKKDEKPEFVAQAFSDVLPSVTSGLPKRLKHLERMYEKYLSHKSLENYVNYLLVLLSLASLGVGSLHFFTSQSRFGHFITEMAQSGDPKTIARVKKVS